VGIIPALGLLTKEEHPNGPIVLTPWQLLAWCFSLAFFGVFVAVPLRYQTIIREKLRFPSGTATASVIRTLHGVPEPAAAAAAAAAACGEASAAAGSGGGGVQGGVAGGGINGSSPADLEVAVQSVSLRTCYCYSGVTRSTAHPSRVTTGKQQPASFGRCMVCRSLQQQQQQQQQ
jgi:uncharacterized oligopeptide transporter (OPT) family protein